MKNADWDEGLTASDRARTKPIKLYAALLFVTFIPAIVILPAGGVDGAQPIWAWALAALPFVFGTLLAFYYYRFIRASDEMLRRVHLEALAAGFGVAFVFGLLVVLLGQFGYNRFSGLAWFAMLLTYAVRLRAAQKEYNA